MKQANEVTIPETPRTAAELEQFHAGWIAARTDGLFTDSACKWWRLGFETWVTRHALRSHRTLH